MGAAARSRYRVCSKSELLDGHTDHPIHDSAGDVGPRNLQRKAGEESRGCRIVPNEANMKRVVILGSTGPEILKLLDARKAMGKNDVNLLGFLDDDRMRSWRYIHGVARSGRQRFIAEHLRGLLGDQQRCSHDEYSLESVAQTTGVWRQTLYGDSSSGGYSLR